MKNEELAALIDNAINDAKVSIIGDGYHYNVKVISVKFAGLTKVKRQQMVYQILHPYIISGELHAVSIETFTPEEAINS